MTITEIYNLLAAGKKVRLSFVTKQVAENFRTALHHLKTAQETHLIGVGMLSVEDVETLSFRAVNYPNSGPFTFDIYLNKRSILKQYDVTIIEDESQ